jgi:peptide/nickel transport system permease protein
MMRRLLRYAGIAVLVTGLNFLLPRWLPGSPVIGGETAAALPAAAQRALIDTYHLDDPPVRQFARYVADLARGDLGRSIVSHRAVRQVLAERLPWTLGLVCGAVFAAALLGGAVGWLAATRPARRGIRLLASVVFGIGALPEFLLGMILIIGLATRLRMFPPGGGETPFLDASAWLPRMIDLGRHAALPWFTLVLVVTPVFALLIRNVTAPLLRAPFLLAARARGASGWRLARHVWRNAIPPVVTLLGIRLGAAVAGAAVVERLFAYPGLGWLLFEAVSTRDYPMIQGIVLISSLAVLAMNLALDTIGGWLDPRTATS